LWLVQELDRVLDGHDVVGAVAVGQVDDGASVVDLPSRSGR
jgi:hypothetical protein